MTLRPPALAALVALCMFPFLGVHGGGAGDTFRRGDSNGDGESDIADPIHTLQFLFGGVGSMPCADASDSNDDGTVDIADPIWTLQYLFFGGPPPAAPGPDACGIDLTADGLAACDYPDCASPGCSLDLTFATVLGGLPLGTAVAEAIDAAAARTATPEFAYIDGRVAADAPGSEELLVLDAYHPESGVHTFFYLRVRAAGATLDAATNIDVVAEDFGPSVSEPVPILETSAAMSVTLRAALDAILAAGAVSGGGGDDDVLDGTTTFLSLRAGGSCVQHALYGVGFEVEGAGFSPPSSDPDLSRYVQDDLVYDLWVELFGPPVPVIGAGAGLEEPDGGGAGGGGIVIRGNQRFKDDVLAGLQAISPCYIYTLEPNTCRVLLQSPADFAVFCECYCDHLAGTNLICDLGLGTTTTTIRKTSSGSRYYTNSNTVYWNPTRRRSGRDENGSRDRPPKLGLAHELIHAHHDHNGGVASGSTGGILNEEIHTCRGENQIRAECGQAKRTHYGNREVPNPCDSNIDGSNRSECPCEREGGDTGDGNGGGDGS